MFSRQGRLPVDLYLGTNQGAITQDSDDWVQLPQERLQDAYERAQKMMKKCADRKKAK